MKIIGLIVNPVAGMGGAVGLKGTDGEMYIKALELGARPVTPARTRDFLEHIEHKDEVKFLTGPDLMGEKLLMEFEYSFSVLGELIEEGKSSSSDTIDICRKMVDAGAELIIFVGGDGTARDIYDAIGLGTPVVAVPSGVKIFSGVFAVNASAAGKLVDAFIEGTGTSEEEVLDIDEDAYRENRLEARLYGYLTVPQLHGYVQHSKSASSQADSDLENKLDVAEWVVEKLESDTLYLLGPGTTVKAITDFLDLSKTLLGVDALFNSKIIAQDLNEVGILNIFCEYPERRLIITPIGGNGFILGRGNKQITPDVLEQVGLKNILVVSTKEKIFGLDGLRVDTGNSSIDNELRGYLEVIIGYREARMMKVL